MSFKWNFLSRLFRNVIYNSMSCCVIKDGHNPIFFTIDHPIYFIITLSAGLTEPEGSNYNLIMADTSGSNSATIDKEETLCLMLVRINNSWASNWPQCLPKQEIAYYDQTREATRGYHMIWKRQFALRGSLVKYVFWKYTPSDILARSIYYIKRFLS